MSEIRRRKRTLELHNQMQMSPQEISYRWGLSYEELAEICCVSKSTAYHWLGGRASRRPAGRPYQRILAMTDFLLTNSEQVQPLLECWPRQTG